MDSLPMVAAMGAAFFLGFFFGGLVMVESWQSDLINRGMAQYCPDTGEWAFKGECEG
jgi:hypothetical protein